MPYREKRIHCGDYLDVKVYPITKEERRQPRRRKKKFESREAQRILNDKSSRENMRYTMECNFTIKDLFLTLTYADAYLPRTIEEAERNLDNYIKRLNRERKNRGLPNLKYIAVTEFHEGERKTRVHHHIVLDGQLERDVVEKKWKKGRANTKRLQPDERGFEQLANYLSKSFRTAKGKKKWKRSRGNLVKPTIKINDHKYSGRKVAEIARCPEDSRVFEKIYKGYVFTDCKTSINKMTDGIYLHIRMRKIQI